MDLLEEFLAVLPIEAEERRYLEVTESTRERISKAYKKVYPHIAEPIENFYVNFCNLNIESESKGCSHQREKIYVYKVGDCYLCRICDTIVRSPT